MAKAVAWRRFRRMQASACLTASLIYAWAGVHAWRVLPGSTRLKCAAIVIFPAIYLGAAVTLPLVIAPLRRLLKRYVWMSFTAGFGQTPISVLAGLGVFAAAAGFIALQIAEVAHGGRYPMSVFASYGAGIGILLAQSLLTGALEREADVQAAIEAGTAYLHPIVEEGVHANPTLPPQLAAASRATRAACSSRSAWGR